MRSSSDICAQNLVLRRQLASYIERGIKPRRLDHAGRASLSVLSRLFDLKAAVVIVRPSTIIRWHRLGWRIFWCWKSRAGRPCIPAELQSLIRRMATENPLWGEERIGQRIVGKARDSGVTADGAKIHACNAARRSTRRSAVVDIPKESRQSDSRLRLLRRRDRDVPVALCVCGDRAWDATAGAYQRDVAPDSGVDATTTAGSNRWWR